MQKSTHCGLEFDILSSLQGNNNSKNMRNIAGIIKLRYTNKNCQFTVKIGSNTYSLSTTSKWSSARSSWARTRLVYVTIMRSGSHFGYFYVRSAFVTSASLYLKVPNTTADKTYMSWEPICFWWEWMKWSPKMKCLDVWINAPWQYHKKHGESSKENIDLDIGAWRVKVQGT